jgi:hypothetical protein
VHRAGRLVRGLLFANGVEEAVERRLREARRGLGGRRQLDGIELAIRSPNTVPWPQPVVTTRLAVFSSNRSMPARVLTAAAWTSQSTVIESMSSQRSTRRWLRR